MNIGVFGPTHIHVGGLVLDTGVTARERTRMPSTVATLVTTRRMVVGQPYVVGAVACVAGTTVVPVNAFAATERGTTMVIETQRMISRRSYGERTFR